MTKPVKLDIEPCLEVEHQVSGRLVYTGYMHLTSADVSPGHMAAT